MAETRKRKAEVNDQKTDKVSPMVKACRDPYADSTESGVAVPWSDFDEEPTVRDTWAAPKSPAHKKRKVEGKGKLEPRALDFGTPPLSQPAPKKQEEFQSAQPRVDINYELNQKLTVGEDLRQRLIKYREQKEDEEEVCPFCNTAMLCVACNSPQKRKRGGGDCEEAWKLAVHLRSQQCSKQHAFEADCKIVFGAEAWCDTGGHLSLEKWRMMDRDNLGLDAPEEFQELFSSCRDIKQCQVAGDGLLPPCVDTAQEDAARKSFCLSCKRLTRTQWLLYAYNGGTSRPPGALELKDCADGCPTIIQLKDKIRALVTTKGMSDSLCPIHQLFDFMLWGQAHPEGTEICPPWLHNMSCACPRNLKLAWCGLCKQFDVQTYYSMQLTAEEQQLPIAVSRHMHLCQRCVEHGVRHCEECGM